MSQNKISTDEILHISKLSRLELTTEEVSNYSLQLSKAVGYFEQISQVETTGVEPLITPVDIENILRPDEVIKEISSEEILKNAPHKTGSLFTVPPVV